MPRGPAAAAAWVIAALPYDHPPIEAAELLTKIGVDLGWFTDRVDASDYVDRWKRGFLNRLARELNIRREYVRVSRFEFNSSTGEYIQGSCFCEPADPPEVVKAKRSRAQCDFYRAPLTAITPREFEGVCREVLVLLGCGSSKLTPRANDQGVDFFGVLEMRGRLNKVYHLPAVDQNMRTWVVGQAKQYSGEVPTSDIRDLVGALILARANVCADGGISLSGFSPKLFEPVYLMFITTGRFTRDSWTLVKSSGMLVLDMDDLVAFLADNEVAHRDGLFDADFFSRWLRGA
jgi:hypothetical protein